MSSARHSGRPDNLPAEIQRLVDRFTEHADAYLHAGTSGGGRYNETQIRREFIDPLFKALGWDIDNEQGYAEAYKDVIHEDAIKIGGATKAPDYCFRIGGVRKFFVEAKKPTVDIKADASPAYQLRRYAWSAKLPLSILTDFEEIAVYDCRVKPNKTDKASKARTLFLRYDELPDRWGELAAIFSREAILKGSFDRYAESSKKKRGTAEVDDAFLAEIEDWRDILARNLALRNEDLTQRDLNFAVQRTIDRIVFLRICEDRGIEQYGTLQALTNGEKVYARLFERFRRADERYNSGLFHFSKERGRPEHPDDLTPGLVIDDKPLKDILRRLYYPDCPYEFSVLPADILGHVYEQFLGKVIRLTPGHRAVVEEKPEVRKAGGVYYTPTYIVDYIVQHTVGQIVEGQSPRQVGALTANYQPSKARNARPLAVLDPACGSGSFLLGAYQFLLDWYRDWYVNDGPKNHTAGRNPRLYQHPSGEWRLTTAERKRILLSHIHGVDIDSQAVEVTKLSLLLKVLEGESAENLDAGLRLFHERALPDLSSNIKCGNSLIGPDFYDNAQMDMFDEEARLRINVFDWNAEFKDIMNAGGFDAVIGNPPYISFYARESIKPDPNVEIYLKNKFQNESGGRVNTFLLFIAQSIRLISDSGKLGMIVPDTLASNESYEVSRKLLIRQSLTSVRRMKFSVFEDAHVRTVIPVIDKASDDVAFEDFDSFEQWSLNDPSTTNEISRSYLLENARNAWQFGTAGIGALLDKILRSGQPLSEFAITKDGVNPGPKTFRDQILDPKGTPKPTWRDVIEGTQVRRYELINPLRTIDYDETLLTPELKKKGASLRNPQIFYAPKLVNRQTSASLIFTYDSVGICTLNSVHNTKVINADDSVLLYLLGILNSRLLGFYYNAYAQETRRVFPQVHISTLRKLPIVAPKDDSTHQALSSAVQTMLDLHKQLPEAKTAHAKTAIQRQIDATDRRIDQMVYALYGLTDEEIAIVEEAKG